MEFKVSINRTIRALGIAKSSIYYKPKSYPERKRTTRKQLTGEAKASILEITGTKATYGYFGLTMPPVSVFYATLRVV